MDSRTFYSYLAGMRAVAVRAECARDAIRATEERLTRISSGSADGMRVSSGSVDYDRTAMRVHALQEVRRRQGRDLSRAVAALKRFKAELAASGLGEDERDVLWCHYVLGMRRSKEIAERLGVQQRHVWPMLTTARSELARSMGVSDDGGH